MKRLIVIIILWLPTLAYSQASNYLILGDIGNYKQITKGGPSGDILAATDHFGEDHQDESYGIAYHNKQTRLWVEVQVTKHADPPDAVKWLLHEVERDFRTYYGLPDDSFAIKSIDNNVVLVFGAAGWTYRWVCGNKVVQIEYHDSQMSKPEPLEVVKAYLAKHPSTLPATTSAELRTAANKTNWIKDEMDRRLWLCDKWFMQLQLRKVDERLVYQESVKSMNIFLDYREKYYGMKAADEKNLLSAYLNTNNGTGIKAKLDEYKKWWVVNKEKAINL